MSGGRSILLVEDHAESRASLAYVLEKRGEIVHQAANGRAALAVARHETLHALILDLKLPDMDGLSVLDAVLEEAPGLPAIVVTGFGTIDSAVEAMKRGASDFLTKPIQVDNLLATLDRSIERAGASGAVSTPPSVASAEMAKLGIVGESRAMQELFDTLKRMAPYDSTVLILGESGTGKELIARALHALGSRAAGPFVPINCATLSDQILESELFGHEKGAFTSADRPKPGVMETADGGTLFLDEVSEMGLRLPGEVAARDRAPRVPAGGRDAQDQGEPARGRRVQRQPRRFGRGRPVPRRPVLPAQGHEPRGAAAAGAEGGDPRPRPAPARRGDAQRAPAGEAPQPEALAQLERYDWPGNVRELRNVMESAALIGPKGTIDVEDLPANVRKIGAGVIQVTVGTRLDEVERQVIQRTLDSYPTVKESARVLGIGLRTLHSKIRRYGLRSRRS